MIESLVFYATAVMVVFAGLAMILMRNPVHSALCLVLAFVASAVLWLLLEAEFLALMLIFVYVGAVMTLFLFVVMMLNLRIDKLKRRFVPYFLLVLLVIAAMLGLMLMVVGPENLATAIPIHRGADYSNIKELGLVLDTEYIFPLELAAVILLVAMVSAVSLTQVKNRSSKAQVVAQQVKAKRSERVRLVSMPAEVEHRQDKKS